MGSKFSMPRFRKILQVILRDSESGADTALWLAGTRPTQPEHDLVWFDRADPYRACLRTHEDQPRDAAVAGGVPREGTGPLSRRAPVTPAAQGFAGDIVGVGADAAPRGGAGLRCAL